MNSYHYQLCGLPEVYLANGYTLRQGVYGESVSIDDIKGLHQAIGMDLATKASQLTADEIRFLRKEMDMSQNRLAETLGVTEVTVRKWESGENNISKPAERVMRIIYSQFATGESRVFEIIDRITKLDRHIEAVRRKTFRETKKGWKKQAA